MPIKPEDRDYFAFITHFGLYRWKRVPYGWRNAGSHFCYLIDKILAGLKYQILTSYVDDILIYGGRNFIEHVACLNIVMDKLQKAGMTYPSASASSSQRSLLTLASRSLGKGYSLQRLT